MNPRPPALPPTTREKIATALHRATILTAPAVAHDDRLLYVGEYPTGILSTCDRCLGEYLLVLQVNEARTPARS